MPNSSKKYVVFFPVPDDTYKRAKAIIQKVKTEKDKRQYAKELADVVAQLTGEGMQHFFELPLKRAKINFFAANSARVGISMAKRGIDSVASGMLRSMSNEQLLEIAHFMDEIIREVDDLES